jgi:methionyl-tRNA formyltransferase
MRVVFAGTPSVAVPSLRALVESRHDVVAVVTRPDSRRGRGRTLARSEVGQTADELGIGVLTPHHPRDPDFQAELRELEPDAVPIVAYGALVPQPVLDIPTYGWINLHFSLLPAWRGAAPVQHALLAGDEVTGATTFRLDAGMDTGDVFGLVTESIRPRDTSGDLLSRLATSGAGLLVATLDGIEAGQLVAVPQSPDDVSYAPKLTTEDARVRWNDPAMRVDRLVRACTPAPGAWTTFRGDRVKLGPMTMPADEPAGSLAPGQLRVHRDGVFIGSATTPLALETVQPPGKRAMPAADWARGVRPGEGEVFV